MTTLQGVIHGKTIELEREPGLPDGEAVSVAVQRLQRPEPAAQAPVPPVESWCERIDFDSAVSPTEKVVKGTRLLAESLVGELNQGKSDDQLRQAHPELTAEDLAALRNYARWPVGLRRSFGAWADEAEEVDRFLECNRHQRKLDRWGIDE